MPRRRAQAAQLAWDQLDQSTIQTDIDNAQADVTSRKTDLENAQTDFNKYADLPIDNPPARITNRNCARPRPITTWPCRSWKT